ncbi:hypothetical protein TNCV_4807081 [Trichonephila clavipes]|nr:hypothetical protein TNCV_4807081 [Trichonephila clavipes]
MSNEVAINLILVEVAVLAPRPKGSLSRVTSVGCHLTSQNLFTTFPKCPTAYSKLLIFKSFLICIFPSRFTSWVVGKELPFILAPKNPKGHAIEKTLEPVTAHTRGCPRVRNPT